MINVSARYTASKVVARHILPLRRVSPKPNGMNHIMPIDKATHPHHIIPNTQSPNPQINTLHNHTTSLLQLPQNPRHSIHNLLHLILLLRPLLLVRLVPGILV